MSQAAVAHRDQLSTEPSETPEVTFHPELATLLSPLSRSAETIRAVRTNILAQHVHLGRRALAMCSPNIDAGCTFLSVNMAVAAAQTGLQVLLVDADLREPGVSRFIKPAAPVGGLADCLASSEGRAAEYIQPNVLPGLSILYAGHAAVNAQELLAREKFEHVINSCLRDYDLTIIDTPPANTYADALRIAHVASYALIVARRNKSLVPDVKTLVEQLRDNNADVIGTVMNA